MLFSMLFFYGFLLTYGNCLTLVLVSMGDNNDTGIYLTGPAIDVAMRDANVKYDGVFQNATRKIIYKPGVMSCAMSTQTLAEEAGNIWRTVMDANDSVVFLDAGCSLEAMVLGDFAREWNTLLLPTQAGSAVFANRDRYGTTVLFGPTDFAVLTEATVFFIDHFGWRTITVMCELLPPERQEKSSFNSVGCLGIQKALINGSGKYTVHMTYFDPVDTVSYPMVLQKVARESRIILIYTDIDTVRRILVAAAAIGMTLGDHVYLTAQSLTYRIDGKELWRSDDGQDSVAFKAMKSLIVVTSQPANWKKIDNVVSDTAMESRRSYNYSCKPREVNELTISSYEAVMTLAEVIYGLPEETVKDGRKLARLFSNRTFSIDSRDIFVNQIGIRTAEIIFWREDIETKVFERAWSYSRIYRRLKDFRLSASWPNRTRPPPDGPLCGFHHEICDMQSRTQIVGAVLGAVLAVGLCVIGVLLVRRNVRETVERNQASWLLRLDPSKLRHVDDNELQMSTARDPLLPKFRENVFAYENQWLWSETASKLLPADHLISNSRAVALAAKMKAISHSNLVEFVGVYSDTSSTRLFWKYGSRGTLRSFLDSGRVSSELRIPICWDVITGLQYLHRSGIKFHGGFNSLSCMVDQQFSAQLCGTATSRLFACFSATKVGFISVVEQFWLAPELLRENHSVGSSEGDIFALGIVICEVVTGRYPMTISFDDPKGLTEKAALLEKTVDRITPGTQIGKAVQVHLTTMMYPSPTLRPTLEKTIALFARSHPRINAVNSLISRMEQFAVELEIQVVARSRDLRDEQTRVDSLLAEIVPRHLIWNLRNKQAIPPETYESFTLLFSALPLFGTICAASTPKQIVSLLNSVYVCFDQVLSTYDVYKVETIKDSYMVASGLPVRNGELHADCIARLALQMRKAVRFINCPIKGTEGLVIRVGVHSGTCVATVIGKAMPRYCLFGDTINTCSRMETSGLPDRIHVSSDTKSILERTSLFKLESRGLVVLKGKGEIETFWLESHPVAAMEYGV